MKYHMDACLRRFGSPAALALAVSFLLSSTASGAQSERLQRLISDVQGGPGTFYTSAALDYLSRQSGTVSQPPMPKDIKAANTALRATIALGDMGSAAREAVGVLIDKFPKGVDVSTVHESYIAGDGSFEDWVMTKVMGEKNKFMFSAPFLSYEAIHKCDRFLDIQHEEAKASEQYSASGRLVSADVTIHVTFTFYAGACALTAITGRDFGTDVQRWRTWWAQEGRTAAPMSSPAPATSPSSSSSRPTGRPSGEVKQYVVGGTYRFVLTTGDDFTGRVESKTDTSLIVDAQDGNGYSFRTAIVRSSELVSLPADMVKKGGAGQGVVEAEILSFDELKRRSPTGKKLEIRIKSGQSFEGTFAGIDGENLRIDVDGSVIPFHKDVVTQIATVVPKPEKQETAKPEKRRVHKGPLDTVIVRNPKTDDYGRRLASLVYAGVIVEDYGNKVTLEKANGKRIELQRADIERISKHSSSSDPSLEPIKRYAMPLFCPDDMILVDVPPMPGTDRPFFKTCIDKYEYPNRRDEVPKREVSFDEARELCAKQGKRLCTTAEWEYACSGLEGYTYPYGNSYDETTCNTSGAKGVMTSGSRPNCVSKFGLYDMSGNVFEWVVKGDDSPMLMGGPLSKCQTVSPGLDGRAKPLTGLRCCKSN
ncbi:MAG: SUMF1/EgtB/PvdO family nonheme iron enzyme [Chitinivibrionales bacterium]|nr:SUMF1/EgtB/PvdO family nonheme iron enzyme [Chitinivibrionales bacterium]